MAFATLFGTIMGEKRQRSGIKDTKGQCLEQKGGREQERASMGRAKTRKVGGGASRARAVHMRVEKDENEQVKGGPGRAGRGVQEGRDK